MMGTMAKRYGFGSVFRRKKKLPDGTSQELPTRWIKFYSAGKVYRESTGTTELREAERLLRVRLGEVAKGSFQGLSIEKLRVAELLDDVLLDYEVNRKAVRFAANAINNHLRSFFGQRRAAAVSTSDISRYVALRRSRDQGTRPYRGRLRARKMIPIKPASNATINRELALLKRAFYLGWRHTPRKVAHVPHIPMLREDNVRKGFFEHEQFLALRRALPEDLRPLLTFAYYTGCRRGEILNLRWEQVDLTERLVRLEPGETKNDEARILPLTNELFAVLSMQKAVRDANYPNCPWVFFRVGGLPVRNFYRAWKTACEQVGLTDDSGEANRLFHDLRRSGIRNLIRAGVPEAAAMRISGHKTRSVFERYNIVTERDLHDAARRLEAYVKEKERTQFGHTLGTLGDEASDSRGESDAKLLN